jgi:hypothetical protein
MRAKRSGRVRFGVTGWWRGLGTGSRPRRAKSPAAAGRGERGRMRLGDVRVAAAGCPRVPSHLRGAGGLTVRAPELPAEVSPG